MEISHAKLFLGEPENWGAKIARQKEGSFFLLQRAPPPGTIKDSQLTKQTQKETQKAEISHCQDFNNAKSHSFKKDVERKKPGNCLLKGLKKDLSSGIAICKQSEQSCEPVLCDQDAAPSMRCSSLRLASTAPRAKTKASSDGPNPGLGASLAAAAVVAAFLLRDAAAAVRLERKRFPT